MTGNKQTDHKAREGKQKRNRNHVREEQTQRDIQEVLSTRMLLCVAGLATIVKRKERSKDGFTVVVYDHMGNKWAVQAWGEAAHVAWEIFA
jgi:hypothetical protein